MRDEFAAVLFTHSLERRSPLPGGPGGERDRVRGKGLAFYSGARVRRAAIMRAMPVR
jgi:hypothetical protein